MEQQSDSFHSNKESAVAAPQTTMKSHGEPKKKPKKKGKKASDDSHEAVQTPPAPTIDVLQDADTAVGNSKEEAP